MNKVDKYIFIDFDGTLVDISKRFYNTYKEILLKYNYDYLNFKDYWNLRRNAIKTADIVVKTCPKEFVEKYYEERNSRFEDLENILSNDQLIVCPIVLMDLKKNGYNLILVSLRSCRKNLIIELEYFKILEFFDCILTGEQFGNSMTKVELIKRFAPQKGSALIIGDTETDINTGKYFGIPSIAVLSGVRSDTLLAKLAPDLTISNFNEVLKHIHYIQSILE